METGNQTQPPNTQSNVDPKVVAILSYITLVGWIVAVVLNNPKNELASFHIRQALGVFALAALGGIVWIVPILGWIAGVVVWIAIVVFWIIGIVGALEGKTNRVPILGDKFQEWFHAL